MKYLNEKKCVLQFVNNYPPVRCVHFLKENVPILQIGQVDSDIFHDLSFLYILV